MPSSNSLPLKNNHENIWPFLFVSCMWNYDPEATVSQEFRERGQQQQGDYKRTSGNPQVLSSLLFRLWDRSRTELEDGQRRKRMRSRPKGSKVSSIPWRKNSTFCQEGWTLEKMPSPKEWLWTSSSPIMCPGGHTWATTTAKNPRTRHTLYQEDDDQHTLRKEATGISTKAALAPNMLNPHKLHMNSPTYKQPSKTTIGNSFS